MPTGAQIIVNIFQEQGVHAVFGYPGVSALPLYDALAAAANIRHILATHEQQAVHAAEGYARASGKTGVVLATSGPGATNLVTGLANAYMDSVPLVAVTCNVPRAALGKDSFQEVDIAGVTMPITKHNVIVKDVHDLAAALRMAFRVAQTGRKGPVLVDVTTDATQASCAFAPETVTAPASVMLADDVDFAAAAALIDECERPALYAGGGVNSAGAQALLAQLADRLHAPVALSLMGLGAFSPDDPLYMGLHGAFGSGLSQQIFDRADLVIAMGVRFSDRGVPDPTAFAPGARVLHLDVDPAEVNKNVPASFALMGDLHPVLTRLLKIVSPKKDNPLARMLPALRERNACPPPPAMVQAVLDALAQLPGERVYTTEVGEHQMWTAQLLPVHKPRTLLTAGGLGAMGFGLGAAVGATLATGGRVVHLTGDGSFHMNAMELSTAALHQLPIVTIVLDNRALGLVRRWQQQHYGGRYFATGFDRPTDYPALARALGCRALEIAAPEDAHAVLGQALGLPGPTVVYCRLKEDF